jgi:hypothetical protein
MEHEILLPCTSVCTPSHVNPFHTLHPYFTKIRFSIILQSTARSSECISPQFLQSKVCMQVWMVAMVSVILDSITIR